MYMMVNSYSSKKLRNKTKGFDSSLALITEGYLFLSNRMKKYQTDVFETRLMGKKAICLSGEEAARLLYMPELFERKQGIPKRIQRTLFGENAIQTMDGEDHLYRKQMFLFLFTPDQETKLMKLVEKILEEKLNDWIKRAEVNLFAESKEILCEAACQWAGVLLSEVEVKSKARDFSALIDAFGGVGARYHKGKAARRRLEEWLVKQIHEIRCGNQIADEETVIYKIAYHKELDGEYLSDHMAAVELINVIRPIVAISTYITFAAFAVYRHPKCKKMLRTKNLIYMEMFLQEVRRFYPFGPFLGARVKENFTWKSIRFRKGTLVLLDVYGMNHDPKRWLKANQFWPENFLNRKGTNYDFIPQGGGEVSQGHRCPGEGITLGIMKVFIEFTLDRMEYKVPKQDLRISLVRVPTYPKSGFVMKKVRRK